MKILSSSSVPSCSHRYDTAPTPALAWLRAGEIARCLVVIVCALLGLSVSSAALAAAPYLRTDRPIKDEQGRIEVIVDFFDDAHRAYPDKPLDAVRAREQFMPMPQTLLLVEAFKRSYGFKRTGMTSWVGNSVTAFLSPEQIERLRGDKVVKQVSENRTHQFSTVLPPWGNAAVGNEWKSWGHQAVSGVGPIRNAGNSNRVVYVIDSGVADHADLNMHPTFPRVNVACGSGGDCDTVGTAAERAQYPVVGCYAHGTHVAGIIGATDNGAGTVGVYAGVKMRSVSLIKATAPYTLGVGSPLGGTSADAGWCANLSIVQSTPFFDSANVGYALDWVYNRILFDNAGVGIVNMSFNSGAVGLARESNNTFVPDANNGKLRKLATPMTVYVGPGIPLLIYPGAFVAQSAGNFRHDSCRFCGTGGCTCPDPLCNPTDPMVSCDNLCNTGYSQAYTVNRINFPGGTDPADGIMVVGAHHHTGEATSYTVPMSPSFPVGVVGAPSASNFGKCIDTWAPGNSIVSSFGQQQSTAVGAQTVVGTPYSGNVNQPNNTMGWLFLSGTSMAAPHVAGAAAYVADAFNLTSPAAIEQKLRTYLTLTGFNDPSSVPVPVNTIQLP